MAIPRNKNLTKQLNSYSYVIAITLQGLLQRTKRALSLNRAQSSTLHSNDIFGTGEKRIEPERGKFMKCINF